VTENLEIRTIKHILLMDEQVEWQREQKSAMLVLVKNLLYLAKNEQLFSSLLQLLFSEPANIPVCMVILKVSLPELQE